MYIDTHAHIFLEPFRSDLPLVIQRAKEQKVDHIILPNVDSSTVQDMMQVTEEFSMCTPAIGLHPCSVKDDFEKELEIVEHWLAKRSFCAIGEIGTDLYWDSTYWEQQQEAFKIQVTWAKQYNLPLIIHCRDSIDQTIELLEPFVDDKLTGVFHCFTGNLQQARRIMRMNFSLGIGGVVTFKNGGLDKIIDQLPLERLLLETDAPYLAPVPNRGKRNEPSWLPSIAHKVAQCMGVSAEQVAKQTTENAKIIFSLS